MTTFRRFTITANETKSNQLQSPGACVGSCKLNLHFSFGIPGSEAEDEPRGRMSEVMTGSTHLIVNDRASISVLTVCWETLKLNLSPCEIGFSYVRREIFNFLW